MPGCAVATCKTYNRDTKGKDIIYHTFPLDANIQKVWIEKCKRKDTINLKTARICSQHFCSESYIRDLKSELLGLPSKRRLKPDAIPTLNLPTINSIQSNSSELPVNSSSAANRSTVVHKVLKKTRCLICNVAAKPLFRVPSNIARLKTWLRRLGLEKLMEQHNPAYIQNNARLCSIHFDDKVFSSTLKTKLSRYSIPIDQCTQSLSSTVSNSSDLYESEEENQSLEQGDDNLNQKLKDVNNGDKDQAQLCELEEENKILKQKIDDLKHKLKDLNDCGKNPVWLFCEFKEENKILKKEIDDLKQKLQDMNGGIKRLANLLRNWKEENRIVMKENEDLKQKLKEVKGGENRLANLLSDWKEENIKLKKENEDLMQKLNGGEKILHKQISQQPLDGAVKCGSTISKVLLKDDILIKHLKSKGLKVLYKIEKIPKKSSEPLNKGVSSNNIFVIKNIPSKPLESQNSNVIYQEISNHASESAETCVTSSHIVSPVNETTTEQIKSPNLEKDVKIISINKLPRKRLKVPANKVPTKQIKSSNLKIPHQETPASVSFIENVPAACIFLPENHTQVQQIESQDLELCPDKAKICYPRKCDICLKSFSCKSSFFRHKRKQHGNSTNEICLVLHNDVTTEEDQVAQA